MYRSVLHTPEVEFILSSLILLAHTHNHNIICPIQVLFFVKCEFQDLFDLSVWTLINLPNR